VVTGSTLPTNRYAQLELYMDAYRNGLIDKEEVLKKTEIFDVEGVLQRTDTIEQLSRQLQQAQEQIKKMGGDMQTRDRENVNLKQRVEVEKFKAGLDKISNRAQSAGTLYEKRLDDATSEMASELRRTRKEAG
jgi:cytochrome c556